MSDENNNDRKQELLLLGQIHGMVQSLQIGQDQQNRRMDKMEERQEERHNAIDKRLRVVEQKAAVAGAISGSAVSIGIALAIEGAKQFLGRGGPGQ